MRLNIIFKRSFSILTSILLLSSNFHCRYNELKIKSGADSPEGLIIGTFLQNLVNQGIANGVTPYDIFAISVDSSRVLLGGNRNAVIESTDGKTFKRTTIKVPDCGTSDSCNIIGAGYENNSYYLIGQKLNTTYNDATKITTVNTNKFYYLKTSSLGTGTFTEILGGTSEYNNPAFIVKNSIMHFSLDSGGSLPNYKLLFSSDGSNWNNSGLSSPQCNRGRLYYDGTRVVCNINANFTGTSWQSATHVGNSYANGAGFINSKYIAATDSNGIWELTAGLITGGTFTLRQSISNLSTAYSPVYNSTIGKYLILFAPNLSPTAPTTISATAYTSTNATTWTSASATGLSVTSIKAVYSFGNFFYLLGTNNTNFPPEIHLYQSSDGVAWTKHSNTGIQ